MTTADLAYMAGYFDGDGCVSLMKQSPGRFQLRVQLVSYDYSSLLVFQRCFGGKIGRRKSSWAGKASLYRWDRNGIRAQMVLHWLCPFLRAKKSKAIAALELKFPVLLGTANAFRNEIPLGATGSHRESSGDYHGQLLLPYAE